MLFSYLRLSFFTKYYFNYTLPIIKNLLNGCLFHCYVARHYLRILLHSSAHARQFPALAVKETVATVTAAHTDTRVIMFPVSAVGITVAISLASLGNSYRYCCTHGILLLLANNPELKALYGKYTWNSNDVFQQVSQFLQRRPVSQRLRVSQ